MATTKPRINMALRPEHYDVVTRLAKLQRRSRSAVVVELLEQAIPVLERVVVVGEAAQRAQSEAREQLRSSLEKAEAAVLPHVTAAMDQLDMLLPAPGLQSGDRHLPPGMAAAPRNASSGSAAATRSRRRPPRIGRRGDPRPVTRGSAQASKASKKHGGKRRKSQ